jgi:hypothetical protein
VLLWTVGRVSAHLDAAKGSELAAAALAAGIALAGQSPPGLRAQLAETRQTMASDRTFVRSLETALPPEAMIFMLPVVDCPEGARVRKATDYEHFRLYLFSTRLRFSYGSDKGRPREAWQRRVESLEPEAMAAALERTGFAGLVVNRKAYPDGAQELREALARAGRVEAWESPDHDFLFVRLVPSSSPLPPDAVVPPESGSEGA